MSQKPKALYYTILKFLPENRELLDRHFDVLELPDPDADNDTNLAQVDLVFAPLGYQFGLYKLKRRQKLKVIASNTTSVPHIDLKAAENLGITVISLKNERQFLESITATAEHTWGLLLAVLRKTPWSFKAVMDGTWNRFEFGGDTMLSRMDLGIIGLGRLGKMVAGYGKAFGMRVRYYDPYIDDRNCCIEKMPSLESLVSSSNVISIHVPANTTTLNMINDRIIEYMQPGTIIINTSRGEVIEEGALLNALKKGRLRGAALDVLNGEFEPGFKPSSHPLVKYAMENENLLITPHIGGSTIDAWCETQKMVISMAIKELCCDISP